MHQHCQDNCDMWMVQYNSNYSVWPLVTSTLKRLNYN